MREHLESLLMALAVGSSVAIAAKRWGIPYNVALVLVGLAAVLTNILPSEPLDPALVMLVFLPMLVFEASQRRCSSASSARGSGSLQSSTT